ncbi:MAG: site-specific DNA-methyltransferase [Rhodobacteraceae bacterium]|nr:site-specific DNA-methyltransferase [Paracoccaceae bacterium]
MGCKDNPVYGQFARTDVEEITTTEGRFPANLIHDGSDEVVGLFPETGPAVPRTPSPRHHAGSVTNFQRGCETSSHKDAGGSAARFFYTAKAGKRDRISRWIEEVTIEWISENEKRQALLRVDMERSHEKDIVVLASTDDHGWNTFWSGNTITDLFRRATTCTTSTATSSTTRLKTWNWLMRLLTSACTVDASCATASGGSPVENAANESQSLTITLGKSVCLPGANRAVSGTQLKINVSGKLHGHPTVKPVDLMQYLVRLVTPKGGVVLDPFAGTGTTGEAALLEGMRPILIEREAEYQEDIRRRLALVTAGPDEKAREIVKARGELQDETELPLFGHPL